MTIGSRVNKFQIRKPGFLNPQSGELASYRDFWCQRDPLGARVSQKVEKGTEQPLAPSPKNPMSGQRMAAGC